ncbi:sugar phosphate isomerase/epimerase family protein [Aquirufa nivalisilvae]
MERRIFLKGLALGVSGLYAHSSLAANPYLGPLGVQLYTVRDAVAKDLEGSLEKLAGLGYKNLEIYGYNGTFFGKTAHEFKTILDRVGLKVVSSHHTSGIAIKSKGTLSDGWQKAVEDLHHVGAEFMVCAFLFPNERSADHYKALPSLLTSSGEATKSAGIQFAYHNHDFEFVKSADFVPYDFILQNTSPDLVKMEADLYWFGRAGIDPVTYFEKHPGRFPLWHVKDMEAGTKVFTEVGNGTIDFDRIFAARKAAGLKYWFVEQDVSKRDPFESLKISRDYLAKKNF